MGSPMSPLGSWDLFGVRGGARHCRAELVCVPAAGGTSPEQLRAALRQRLSLSHRKECGGESLEGLARVRGIVQGQRCVQEERRAERNSRL